jgi:hypothetical protein
VDLPKGDQHGLDWSFFWTYVCLVPMLTSAQKAHARGDLTFPRFPKTNPQADKPLEHVGNPDYMWYLLRVISDLNVVIHQNGQVTHIDTNKLDKPIDIVLDYSGPNPTLTITEHRKKKHDAYDNSHRPPRF